MIEKSRFSLAKKFGVGFLSFVAVTVVVFALFGRGPDAGSITPGKGGSSTTDASAQGGQSGDEPGSASSANDDASERSTTPPKTSKSTASSVRSASPTNRPAAGSSRGVGVPLVNEATEVAGGVADQLDEAVDTVTDVVDEVADQLGLGDAVDGVTGTLNEVGTDLETVTADVLELVDQGVPLEEAVDTVLGLLPLPAVASLPPIVPTPAPSGGLLGGLLGD